MKLRSKIVSTYVGLTIVGIIVASVVSSWEITTYLDAVKSKSLETQLGMVTALLERRSITIDGTSSNDAFLKQISRSLGERVTLIRADGVVVFDSDVPFDSLAALTNHSSRPEIVAARTGGIGKDLRKSVTLNEDFLYAARRITTAAGDPLDSGFVRLALSMADVQSLNSQIQFFIWGVGLFTIILITVVTYQVSKRITQPLQNIVRTAEAIRNGDVHQRVLVSSRDEIGTLATAINNMAEKLRNDIERLRKLERVRSEFLANVSHELRTPIFSLQGFLETLLDGAVDDPTVNREFLDKAHKHASRLNALLNDLIEISRIESGEMKMSFRYFPIVDLLHQAVEEMHPRAQKKDMTLELVPGVDSNELVFGDRDRLKQVMINLIDNGIKYTEPRGAVRVHASRDGEGCVISVEDSGCGIAPEHIDRIFERFYRVDKDRSREVGGTGLGLAIVKHIVEAHGGVIRVRSQLGQGSTFSFVLKR